MSNDKIKVGIIGAGRMGITHHSIINSHPDVQVTAIADPSTVMNMMIEKIRQGPNLQGRRRAVQK